MKKTLLLAIPVMSLIGIGMSAGTSTALPTPPAAPVVQLGATATCLSNGIEVTGEFTVATGVAVYGNFGVSQIGTVNVPYAATRSVSQWVRTSNYARSAQVTSGTKTLDTTDSTTWTRQDMVSGWTAPTGDTWYEAWYEVDSAYHGSSVTGRDYTDYHCTAPGSTPRVAQSYPSWTSATGSGS